MNITSFEIWLDGTCILMSQNASGEFRFSQLNTPGSHAVSLSVSNSVGVATSNYTDAADLPWTEVFATIKSVSVSDSVEVIGDNLWAGLAEDVVINGETIARRKVIAAVFPADTPAGAISPAEFERIEIVDGKALLGVSVYTNASLEVEKVGVGSPRIKSVMNSRLLYA